MTWSVLLHPKTNRIKYTLIQPDLLHPSLTLNFWENGLDALGNKIVQTKQSLKYQLLAVNMEDGAKCAPKIFCSIWALRGARLFNSVESRIKVACKAQR